MTDMIDRASKTTSRDSIVCQEIAEHYGVPVCTVDMENMDRAKRCRTKARFLCQAEGTWFWYDGYEDRMGSYESADGAIARLCGIAKESRKGAGL